VKLSLLNEVEACILTFVLSGTISNHLGRGFLEEPGTFLLSLLRFARPIAEKQGDLAP